MVAHGSSPQAPPVQLRADVATLAEMLVRPESFFPKLVAVRGKRFPFVAIWIVGAGAAVDRLDSRMLLENFRSTIGADRPNPVLADWTATWASVIVGGLIGGLLIWLVLGWWYRMRLKLCGARPPKRAARNVFIHANLIVGVVSLTLLALQTPFHASYREMWSSEVVAWGWILVFLWSVWISYRGVVSCFDVRPVAALVWFLILPWLVYTGLMALLFTIGVLSAL
jgi:hypothetical protein